MQKSARKYTEIFPLLREIDGKQTTTPNIPNPTPKTTPVPKTEEPAVPKEQVPPSTYDPKKDSANYDKHGNYKPVDQLTPEEIKKRSRRIHDRLFKSIKYRFCSLLRYIYETFVCYVI
ncbi:hypothetical protein ACT7DM_30670 [Bacillus cereus]